ncbi:nucleotidyltransferase family protein [Streptomyces sp. NBC_01481]|uniref:nucleotidyltransferase family protein n=1 Tax=Streptomyces sp. NBC_01481 TaxID=2975869 RepID=UPI00225927DF|nr:nucleotidyltransferase domain-containing protein [Streptomyces sp. NBC_01481]MCX4585052.1 nucleotidyltransferase domain-containing protein [Streptomyces sp. NBC_01481]
MISRIEAMSQQLMAVRGVRAVARGGSRARGTHRPDSDWDLGVYYRGSVDTGALAALATEVTGTQVDIAGPGGWGPWVNGGAWLTVDGGQVDWILRDLDRVEAVWADCLAGRYETGMQAGHPLGFWSPAYAGEVALCRVLADADGELTSLRTRTQVYPEPLRRALIDAAWEADFSVAAARKSVGAGDVLHVSLCLSRAFGVLVQSLHAHARVWCLNEKGALRTATSSPAAPEDFASRVSGVLRGLDAGAVESAYALVAEARSRLG